MAEGLGKVGGMKVRFVRTLVLSLGVIFPALAFGQVGSTTDILMGKVSGLDSQAVPGARVEATSLETGITRTKTTGADGRYTIVFPDGGGSYRLTVRAIGMEPVVRNIARQGDEDRLISDFTMGRAATHPKRMNGTAERSGFTSQGKPAATPRDKKTGQPGKAFAKYRPFWVSMTKLRALKDSGWGGAGTQSLPEAKILA